MALDIGTEAPSFSLPPAGEPEERVTLDKAEGYKLVILFFPMAFTPVCSDEACRASGNLTEFRRRLEAEIIGISVNSPFTLAEWQKQEDFNLPLLSDFNREAIEAYDVKRDELLGLKNVAERSAFVIDQDGIIQYSWETDDPSQMPPFDDIRETVESL